MRAIGTVLIVLSLSGCKATPNLEYREPAPDFDGYMKFVLPQSKIVLRSENGIVTATAVTDDKYRDAQEYSLMVDAKKSLFTSTTITKFAYVDGQYVVKSIGTVAESNVTKISGIVGDLASLAVSTGGSQVFKDEVIDPFSDEKGDRYSSLNHSPPCSLKNNTGWTCVIEVGNYDKWTVDFKDFHDNAIAGRAQKVFPASACLKAKIMLTYTPPTPSIDAGGKTTNNEQQGISVQPDGTLGGNAVGRSTKSRSNVATSPKSLAVVQNPSVAGDEGKPQEKTRLSSTRENYVFGLELADPRRVNLTQLRASGELVANGACRFDVANDKPASNLDSEAFKSAVSTLKALTKTDAKK